MKQKKVLTVLVAEDNPVHQEDILQTLGCMNVKAKVVANGAEAIACINETQYDVILMDCQMPNMDGFQAARIIRGTYSGYLNTPIIAMTANLQLGDREKSLAAGMTACVSKPILEEELADSLKSLSAWGGE